MGLGDAVFGEMDVDDSAGLEEEFPDQRIGDSLVEVADVDRGVFILFPRKRGLIGVRIGRAGGMRVRTYQCLAPDILTELESPVYKIGSADRVASTTSEERSL